MKIPAEQDEFSLPSLSVSPAGRRKGKEGEQEEEEGEVNERVVIKNKLKNTKLKEKPGSITSPKVDMERGA